jgi:hypothetical protein
VMLIAFGQRGDGSPEGGLAEQVVGLEGHSVERRERRGAVRRAQARASRRCRRPA